MDTTKYAVFVLYGLTHANVEINYSSYFYFIHISDYISIRYEKNISV